MFATQFLFNSSEVRHLVSFCFINFCVLCLVLQIILILFFIKICLFQVQYMGLIYVFIILNLNTFWFPASICFWFYLFLIIFLLLYFQQSLFCLILTSSLTFFITFLNNFFQFIYFYCYIIPIFRNLQIFKHLNINEFIF